MIQTGGCSDGGCSVGTGNDLNLEGNTLTIVGDGTTNFEFEHNHALLSGTGTIGGTGQLLLGGGDLNPGSPMTVNVPIDQQTSGSSDTTVDAPGTGGSMIVNSTWTVGDNSISYDQPTGTTPTTVTINQNPLGLLFEGGTNEDVDVPLIVNGSLTNNGTGTWTIDSTNGDDEDCGSPLDCATNVANTATVNANSGTTRFINLTNTGAWPGGSDPAGDESTTNTLTGGTWNVGTKTGSGTLRLPTAGNLGLLHLDVPLTITHSGSVVQDSNSSSTGLTGLLSIDSTGKLILNGAGGNLSTYNGDGGDATSLQTIDGLLQTDGNTGGPGGSAIITNANGSASGTTLDSSGVWKGNNGTFGATAGALFNNGTVQPGDAAGVPGTLNVTSPANQTSYSQGTSGNLNIVLNGVGSGQYGLLDVKDGNVDLDGTLNLMPTSTYANSAAVNDDIPFLVSEQISAVHQFANVTTTPPLSGGKSFTIDYSEPNETEAVVQQGTPNNLAPGATNPAVPPAISGTPTVGQTLSTTNGNWTNSPTSFTYQWYDCSGAALSSAQRSPVRAAPTAATR